MTILLAVLIFLCSCVVTAVSYIHLLCRESLRIKARDLPSLEYYRQTLQERIGLDAENGALTYSLARHIGLIVLAVLSLASTIDPVPVLWRSILEGLAISLLLMLITSYIAPRLLYQRTSGAWSIVLLPLFRGVAVGAKPVIALLDFIESIADLSDKGQRNGEEPTQEEHIDALIEAGKEEGIIEEEDEQLIHSVVAFGDKTVREVMTPRPHIVAIAANRTLEDLRQLVINEQYSRVPVFEGTIDTLIGFVHVRDMFELDAQERETRLVKTMMRPLRCVPETKPVTDLLREMQKDGVHMVGVIDEYGSTAGLATMEDLVEEILGEIRDEHEPGVDAIPEPDGAFVVAGNYDLDHLRNLLDFTPLEETESTTVGGLVTEWLGYVPKVGEAVERHGIRLEVLASDERRVEKLRIQKAVNGSHG